MRMLSISAIGLLTAIAVGGCIGEDEYPSYPGCEVDPDQSAPSGNVLLVNTGTADFQYTFSLCDFILYDKWEDSRPVRMIVTVNSVLDAAASTSVHERACDTDSSSCLFSTVLDVTVEHDFDRDLQPGAQVYLLVIGPERDEATRVYLGNRMVLFGHLMEKGKPEVAIAPAPAIFTERNCYVFGPDDFAIKSQFGDSPVTEAEMASLVEKALRIGDDACVEPNDG